MDEIIKRDVPVEKLHRAVGLSLTVIERFHQRELSYCNKIEKIEEDLSQLKSENSKLVSSVKQIESDQRRNLM